MINGFRREFKPLEIVTEEQVEAIHQAVLDVLRVTGVRFESKRALDDLKNNGCIVDYEEKRVRFPEYVVEECIRRSPSSYRIRARDQKDDVILGKDRVYFENFPAMRTVDLDTWDPRDATWQEYCDLITVFDALPNMHSLNCYAYWGFPGVPSVMAILEGLAIKLMHTTKTHIECNASECDQFTIPMIKAAGGEARLPILGSAPLTWYEDQINSAYRAIEAGFPALSCQGTIMGASGPVTIAGSVVTNLAHELSMVTMLQLLCPGARVHIGDDVWPQNMKSGAPAFGNISSALAVTIEAQMSRRYGLPLFAPSGGPVNSKRIDFQSGYEKALNALVPALAGANIILLHSALYGEITAHVLQAILDDDIAGMIGRYLEGVKVTNDTIALDIIHEVGPIPGHYLATEHTRRLWKEEHFYQKSADALTYPEWESSGKKSCVEYAKERMETILDTHKVSTPLTEKQRSDIAQILREARNYYRSKGMISNDEWSTYGKKVLNTEWYPFS
jgi:trimethylamine--corrinoid protein Co-methyltransferase